MKKILSLILALTFVASVFCISASARYLDYASTSYIQYGTTAYDLKAYGLSTYLAYKVSAPAQLDGAIGSTEYGTSIPTVVATLGNGLSLTNNTGTVDYTDDYGADYQNFSVSTYLAYDNEYLYIAEKVVGDMAISVATSNGNSTLNASVRVGMNQSPNLPEAASRLSNTYSYTVSGNTITPYTLAAGNRTYKVIEGEVSETATLDSQRYADWDGDKYIQNAAVSYTKDGSNHNYVFEYRIPLADIAFSNFGNFDEGNVAKLLALSKLYGSYFFQVAVTRTGGGNGKTQLFLSTGFAGNSLLESYSTSGSYSSWQAAVRDYWTSPDDESLSVAYIPSPVHFVGAYDSSVSAPEGSSFRPGLTGVEFPVIKSHYKIGEKVTFNVVPDRANNPNPSVGDQRVVPVKFTIRDGSKDVYEGTFSSDFKTASFNTSDIPVGVNTLVVTFVQQSYTSDGWINTPIKKNLARTFFVEGSVRGTVQEGASQTGDSTALVILGVTGMLLCVAAVSTILVVNKAKRRSR